MVTTVLPRLLELLELLGAGSFVPGPDLAVALDVDTRTVRRDVERLEDIGYEVESRRGRHGGYRLARRTQLPPLVLDQQEAVALVLGLEAAQRAGLRVRHAERLADRLLRVLPADTVAALTAVRAVASHGPGWTGGALTPGRLLDLAVAADRGRAVDLRYVDARGRRTERIVDVWSIVHHGRHWYVLGHDRRSGDVRTLRVDRVGALLDAGRRQVEPPDGVDPLAVVAARITHAAWRHQVEVEFDAAVETVRRRVPMAAVDLSEEDGRTILRTGADDLAGMALVLAGTGLSCTVRTPLDLADELAALGRRLTARHGV